MSKVMKILSMNGLITRIAGEWKARLSIFDIPELLIRRILDLEAVSPGFTVWDHPVSLPLGPAAGPHTQTAYNLVAAYLAGARVFELKTVQVMDSLDIEKPCIDALDEGYNTEWSTELSLKEARGEYLRAWIAIHLLKAAFSAALGETSSEPLFNLSVGYTLAGIQTPAMDAFIEGMRSPKGTILWEETLEEARKGVTEAAFREAFSPEGVERALNALEHLSDKPIHSVTLSTMHGCPPQEIERIAAYLMEEKGFDVYIKLNPTLLGYERVRSILDTCGWQRIGLKRETFDHDLRFEAALKLIQSLEAKAAAAGRKFGLKLSNTLANINDATRLPGAERYLSGRPLFPVTARLASELAASLHSKLSFSYCGGISARNVFDCLRAGLGPLTAATELLKPGGYLRLEAMAEEAERALKEGIPAGPDALRLEKLATLALENPYYRGDYKKGRAHIARMLPLVDCFAAPCVEACPAGQRAPEYMKALGSQRAEEALSIIYEDNPLPRITGILCDHVCMTSCSRVDYEGPVEIRAMKLIASRRANIAPVRVPPRSGVGKTAVFGAGPAGLACAHYLASAGFPVTLFYKSPEPGGVPANVIPPFRISPEDLHFDIQRIQALGAEFRRVQDDRIDRDALGKEGYSSLVLAIGAQEPRKLALEGAGISVVDALEFLSGIHGGSERFNSYTSVVVAGGGNTAMDAARSAARLPEKPKVSLLYRRSLEEMPADREEFEAALAEGVEYFECTLPESTVSGGELPTLVVREMNLGERDASGRRSPTPSERTREVPCDLVIAAIGETPNTTLLKSLGLRVQSKGLPEVDPLTMESTSSGIYVVGDARRGPASIISAEADGRAAARAIMKAAGATEADPPGEPAPGVMVAAPETLALSRRGEFLDPLTPLDSAFPEREAERCLSCASACLRCVEVCPNRANIALPLPGTGPLKQPIQIIHLDAFCNECGNCESFCPYEGAPFADKPTLFPDEAALRSSGNAGFTFLSSLDSATPKLLLRSTQGETTPVQSLAYQEWTRMDQGVGAESKSPSEALLFLAKTIWDSHRYLLSGALP